MFSFDRSRSASLPVAATRTSKPECRSPRATEVLTSGSSSTMSTVRPALSCAGGSPPTRTRVRGVSDAVAVGVAATILEVHQRLTDAGQLGLRRSGCRSCSCSTSVRTSSRFLPSRLVKNVVDVRVAEQVIRRRRGDTCGREGKVGGGAVGGLLGHRRRKQRRTASRRRAHRCRPRQLPHAAQYGQRATCYRLLHRMRCGCNHRGYRHRKLIRIAADFPALRRNQS